jgi:competence protein ComEA
MGGSTETLSPTAAAAQPPTILPPPAEERVPAAPVAPPPALRPRSDPAPSEIVESHFWLTQKDQLIFGLLSFVALALMGVYWIRLSSWGTRTVEIERLPARQEEFRIDANSATWVEWSQINGIGDGLARRIVADREENGPFQSVEDLRRVKGIGPKTLENLRPWVQINNEEAAEQTEPPPRKRSKKRAPAQAKNSSPEEPSG